jgi:Ser/Thr protein kinase RdoA (MazF antagonist)
MEQVAALLDGYRSVRPLPDAERRALPQLLPVAHVELALSEVEYYLAVRADRGSADLAYRGYLWGHARFFASPPGRRMLDGLRRLLEA